MLSKEPVSPLLDNRVSAVPTVCSAKAEFNRIPEDCCVKAPVGEVFVLLWPPEVELVVAFEEPKEPVALEAAGVVVVG